MTETSETRPASLSATPAYAWGVVIFSAIALIFSALLVYERILTLEDPTHIPACTVNAFISCTDVMNTPQAKVFFGVSNAIFGTIGYSALLALGVTMLTGFHPPRWMWWTLLIGLLCSVIFVHWLFYQSIFVIVALCPYCTIIWGATFALFLSTLVALYRRTRASRGLPVSSDVFLPTIVWCVWAAGIAFLVADRLFF